MPVDFQCIVFNTIMYIYIYFFYYNKNRLSEIFQGRRQKQAELLIPTHPTNTAHTATHTTHQTHTHTHHPIHLCIFFIKKKYFTVALLRIKNKNIYFLHKIWYFIFFICDIHTQTHTHKQTNKQTNKWRIFDFFGTGPISPY